MDPNAFGKAPANHEERPVRTHPHTSGKTPSGIPTAAASQEESLDERRARVRYNYTAQRVPIYRGNYTKGRIAASEVGRSNKTAGKSFMRDPEVKPKRVGKSSSLYGLLPSNTTQLELCAGPDTTNNALVLSSVVPT